MSSTELTDDILLRLLVEDIRRKLTDKIESAVLESVRPSIKAAVDEAMQAMKPRIQSHADVLRGELVVRLVTQEVPCARKD